MEILSITDEATGKEYKFEKPDWWNDKCELFRVYLDEKRIVGSIKIDNSAQFLVKWSFAGQITDGYGHEHLTPIKTKWYEDEANFPALVVRDNNIIALRSPNKEHYLQAVKDGYRLATKDEVLALYYEDKE